MRNAIVNAATTLLSALAAASIVSGAAAQDNFRRGGDPSMERSMSPQHKNKSGGSFGRAAFGTARDAARAEDLAVLARGFAVMAGTVTVLVVSAPDLWPHLFAH